MIGSSSAWVWVFPPSSCPLCCALKRAPLPVGCPDERLPFGDRGTDLRCHTEIRYKAHARTEWDSYTPIRLLAGKKQVRVQIWADPVWHPLVLSKGCWRPVDKHDVLLSDLIKSEACEASRLTLMSRCILPVSCRWYKPCKTHKSAVNNPIVWDNTKPLTAPLSLIKLHYQCNYTIDH